MSLHHDFKSNEEAAAGAYYSGIPTYAQETGLRMLRLGRGDEWSALCNSLRRESQVIIVREKMRGATEYWRSVSGPG